MVEISQDINVLRETLKGKLADVSPDLDEESYLKLRAIMTEHNISAFLPVRNVLREARLAAFKVEDWKTYTDKLMTMNAD